MINCKKIEFPGKSVNRATSRIVTLCYHSQKIIGFFCVLFHLFPRSGHDRVSLTKSMLAKFKVFELL